MPGREVDKDRAGKILEGRDRRGGVLPSWLMSQRKRELNELSGSTRALCQGNCAPNHYWNRAKNTPDFTFIVYHSAIKHGPWEPQFKEDGYFDPNTGDFAWHADLMKIKERNPEMKNVNCEIGSAFGTLAIANPEMCMHLTGRNIKHYGADRVIWGTDCLWWGSPQWVIDALKRFQISDELCDRFGYAKITKEDKAKIFGLNAARIYGIDADAKIKAFPKDTFDRLKTAYLDTGEKPDNAVYG